MRERRVQIRPTLAHRANMPPWMDDDLNARRRQGLYRVRRALGSRQGPRVRFQGREFVNFTSNDYLSLASDSRLGRAAAKAARCTGTGAGASPLVSGLSPQLAALERRLARWEGAEDALVFSSGYSTNLALAGGLVGPEDAVFSDALNHASLIDGCRLSRAKVCVYRHNDIEHLRSLLASNAARRRLIVTDSIFSMDGDSARLAELLDLARAFDAMLLVDEAHATGVLGPGGRGLTELLPTDERLIKVGTLSKALGAQGGFVVGSRRLIDWLVNHARPYIFSTALAPPIAAAAHAAVGVVMREPHRREHLLTLAERLRIGLRSLGLDVGPSMCQIVPVIVGDARTTVALSESLRERGLLVPAIRPPSVPRDTSRLRISVTTGHTDTDIDDLLEGLREGIR
jgi:8-amino-7-oxononanoate synthase